MKKHLDIPDEVFNEVVKSAKLNDRSVNGEITHTLRERHLVEQKNSSDEYILSKCQNCSKMFVKYDKLQNCPYC